MKKNFYKIIFSLMLGSARISQASATPIDDLSIDEPNLKILYDQYSGYHETLGKYVDQQGFRKPYERLGTIVHEMIHIASAMHQGYFINGTYYEPYIKPQAWPALKNKDIREFVPKEAQGLIYTTYLSNTPENNLGNVLDEVNAYGHVLKFICYHEPDSTVKQAKNLVGHLQIVETYLREVRTKHPEQYARLLRGQRSFGALNTIVTRALNSLRECNVKTPNLSNEEFYGLINERKNFEAKNNRSRN